MDCTYKVFYTTGTVHPIHTLTGEAAVQGANHLMRW